MSLDFAPDASKPSSLEGPPAQPAVPQSRLQRQLARTSISIAGAGVAVEVFAIVVGSAGLWTVATVLAWLVAAALAVSLVMGMVAAVSGRGRALGVTAAGVSVLAHPLLLVWVFRLLGGTQ